MNPSTPPLQTTDAAGARYHSVFRNGLFTDRTFWVTGGGSGIGRCVAHELASLGARVVISGRTQEKLDRVAQEIRDDGGQCETQAFDIRDEDAVKAAVAAVVARVGRIDGLVNNAGGQFPAPLQAISKRGFEAVVSNNLTGGFLMMREVFLQSMQEHGGAIVNMTADFRNGMPGMAHSGAARAGMSNLTMSAAFEWAQAGVRVNAVSPGWVASSGMDSYEGAAQGDDSKTATARAACGAWPPRQKSVRPSSSCSAPVRPLSAVSRCRSTARPRWAARSSPPWTTTAARRLRAFTARRHRRC